MALSPRQFWASYQRALHNDVSASLPPPRFPTGSTVYDEGGRPGIVSAQHLDREHVNVQWKPGSVGVHHISELHD